MTLFFYILIGCITFVAFLHTWVKKEFDRSRTVLINKPKAEVYGYIRQLQLQPNWLPWFESRTGVILKFKGEEGKEGATLYWRMQHKYFEEEGIERITKIKPGMVLETQFFFLKPHKTYFESYMAVKELDDERTKLLWGIRGTHRFPASVLSMFFDFNGRLEQHIEEGLENIKFNLENR